MLLINIRTFFQTYIHVPRNSLKQHLIVGSIGTFSLKIFNVIFGLLIGILLARLLGAKGYGEYAYAIALINIMAIPTTLGLPQLIIREISGYHIQNNYGLMRGLLIRANQSVFFISLIIIVITAFLTILFRERLSAEGVQTFLISLCLLPLMGLKHLRMAALRGLKYVLLGQIPEIIIRQAVFAFILLCCYFLYTQDFTPQIAMAFQVLATGVAFFTGAIFLRRKLPYRGKNIDPVYENRKWIKNALPFMFLGAIQVINNRTDIVMLGVFCSAREVGIYQAVFQGASLVMFALGSVNMVLSPTVSSLYIDNNLKKLQRIITISARTVLMITLPLVIILVFAGHWLLSLLFGAEFGTGVNALRILCIGQMITASMGSVGMILGMTGHEKDAAMGFFVAASINIILNFLFIPYFEMNGAATATAISTLIWNLYLAVCVYKRTGLNSFAFAGLRNK